MNTHFLIKLNHWVLASVWVTSRESTSVCNLLTSRIHFVLSPWMRRHQQHHQQRETGMDNLHGTTYLWSHTAQNSHFTAARNAPQIHFILFEDEYGTSNDDILLSYFENIYSEEQTPELPGRMALTVSSPCSNKHSWENTSLCIKVFNLCFFIYVHAAQMRLIHLVNRNLHLLYSGNRGNVKLGQETIL